MTIEILHGRAALSAMEETELPGGLSPRKFRIGEALQARTAATIAAARRGEITGRALREAFSTADFTLAAFATLDKRMLGKYDALPSVWRSYTTVTTVPDFRPTYLLDTWRNTIGFDAVPELTEYPGEDSRGSANYTISVAKYGRRFSLSWESMINNTAIGELENLPDVLAQQAAETEAINAVSNLILADRTGVNTAFFKSANGNAPTALPLTYDNLKTVLTAMAAKKSAISGRVVPSPPLVLVVPKALEMAANEIKNIREIRVTSGANEFLQNNVLSGIEIVVEPMLDYWNTHAKALTTWFILPKPGNSRPATWAAFLRGYETPDLRVQVSAGQNIGGGDISPMEGSFSEDSIQYRGRHIVGHQVGDPTFTYVSLGS